MGVFSTLFGAGWGFGIMMNANAMKKVPLSRSPWLYTACIVFGGYVGYRYPQVEAAMLERVNEKRVNAGMPPMVGSFNMFNLPKDMRPGREESK